MEILKIENTSDSPYVYFDAEKGVFEISGLLIPEDPAKFYQPVIKWSKEYIKSPNPQTVLNLRIEYINTSSSKILMQVLRLFEKLNIEDGNVTINWYYIDEDMYEAAHDFKSILKIPFKTIQVDDF
ncbi:MAG: DUF1987 domain-containing protein [Chlorobi bacterium]|nr:DUF1987 domain-containing protein [Chlorobiota bacterium]